MKLEQGQKITDEPLIDLSRDTGGSVGDAPLDLRILRSLRQIIRGIEIHSRYLANKYHITGHQLVCLIMIKDNGPITEGAVARLSQLSSSTVVGILDRLEEKGLVNRERSQQDRRRVYITATAKGKRLATKGPSPLQASLSAGLKELPELEQAAIALSLERIVHLMEPPHLEKEPALFGLEKKKALKKKRNSA